MRSNQGNSPITPCTDPLTAYRRIGCCKELPHSHRECGPPLPSRSPIQLDRPASASRACQIHLSHITNTCRYKQRTSEMYLKHTKVTKSTCFTSTSPAPSLLLFFRRNFRQQNLCVKLSRERHHVDIIGKCPRLLRPFIGGQASTNGRSSYSDE